MAETWSLFRQQDHSARLQLNRDSWRLGLRAPMGDRTLREVGIDVLAIARGSLQRQGQQDSRGLDETTYLDGLEEIVASGVTLAERLLARWQGTRAEKLQALREHCGFGCQGEPVL
jgi:glutamate--cysteine ligase